MAVLTVVLTVEANLGQERFTVNVRYQQLSINQQFIKAIDRKY
jgi:hypothetical protein